MEDLGSKLGTTINDQKIKGEKYVIQQDRNVLQMGGFPRKFTITWLPVVLSYSFTSRELLSDPLTTIQQNLEQLDIKFLADYNVDATTHVISRKRNTSKGLQALINSRYIVTNQFVDEIVAASTPEQIDEGVKRSRLEADFDSNWPDALKYLPPAGNEPTTRPSAAFAPNSVRAELFEGYTFIFYDQTQYDCLLGPITNGKGKALFQAVTPFKTETDDFVRFVKERAGEKGLGEFEDGSQGKGVVVVRYLPLNPPEMEAWYSQFHEDVSLRLGHRLIDQKDFLDAILACDASPLRRPLEEDSRPTTQEAPRDPLPSQTQQATDTETAGSARSQDSAMPRRPVRGPAKSRFKGFVIDDSDDDMQDAITDLPPPPAYAPEAPASFEPPQDEGLFVSQEAEERVEEPDEALHGAVPSHRKRPAPLPEVEAEDVMNEYAPNAARIKRRRIEAGEAANARQAPRPEPIAVPDEPEKVAKEEIDYLEIAAQNRIEAETRAAAERAALNAMPEDFDPADIRRLRIEEPMEVRQAAPIVRSRDEDVADGRWDPAWNGRKNFKKFQQRGAVNPARPPQRIILGLEEAKKKSNGLGDEYWLEDPNKQWRRDRIRRVVRRRELRNGSTNTSRESYGSRRTLAVPTPPPAASTPGSTRDGYSVDDDNNENADMFSSTTRTRSTRAAASESAEASQATIASRASRDSWTAAKRPAAAPPPYEQQPAKRSKIIQVEEESEEEESEDDLRFRFKRR